MLKNIIYLSLFTSLLLPFSAAAKPPITDHEKDPVMLDMDPYMIKAMFGIGSRGNKGRFGSEGGMKDLMGEPAFVELVKKHDIKLFNGPMLGDIQQRSRFCC